MMMEYSFWINQLWYSLVFFPKHSFMFLWKYLQGFFYLLSTIYILFRNTLKLNQVLPNSKGMTYLQHCFRIQHYRADPIAFGGGSVASNDSQIFLAFFDQGRKVLSCCLLIHHYYKASYSSTLTKFIFFRTRHCILTHCQRQGNSFQITFGCHFFQLEILRFHRRIQCSSSISISSYDDSLHQNQHFHQPCIDHDANWQSHKFFHEVLNYSYCSFAHISFQRQHQALSSHCLQFWELIKLLKFQKYRDLFFQTFKFYKLLDQVHKLKSQMGASYLQKPITTKKNTWEQQNGFKYATCEMQGWRKNMEDSYIAYTEVPGFDDLAIFGVFDGHGGGQVSKYVAAHFLEYFVKRKSLTQGRIGEALSQTFVQLELMMKMKPGIEELIKYKEEEKKDQKVTKEMLEAGATAVVVAITKDKIICANAGDSRATFCQNGKAIPLSFDHKPQNPVQKARIQKTGVPIVNGRVNGLNLTRSIGDFQHKKVEGLSYNKQPITCQPDIIEVSRSEGDEFLLVACDGIWERYGDDHEKLTLEFRQELKKFNSTECLKNFFDKNIGQTLKDGPYGKDNMTAIIIQIIKK